MLEEIHADTAAFKSSSERMADDIKCIKESQLAQEGKYDELKHTVQVLSDKVAQIEKRDRAANLIIYNIPDNDDVNSNLLTNVIDTLAGAEVEIPEVCVSTVFRLGSIAGKRPILIKFIAPRWKKHLFQCSENLKRIGLAISNDVTREEREEEKRLLKARYILKQRKVKAQIRNKQLIVNNKPLSDQEIDELINKSDAANRSSAPTTPTTPEATQNFHSARGTVKKRNISRSRKDSSSSRASDNIEQYFDSNARTTRQQTSKKK